MTPQALVARSLRSTRLGLLALALLAACSASPGSRSGVRGHAAATVEAPTPDAAPGPTAAEQALAIRRDRLIGQRGVLAVDVDEVGNGLRVTLCAAEAAATLELDEVDVPVSTVVADPGAGGRDDRCGCVGDGRYFLVGEAFARDCNTCRCVMGGELRCTLLACDVAIVDLVGFAVGSARLPAAAGPVLDGVLARLKQRPALRIKVRGHAATGEKRADRLSAARAAAVDSYLGAHGVDRAQLVAVEGVGATMPRSKDAAAERAVEFVVVAH